MYSLNQGTLYLPSSSISFPELNWLKPAKNKNGLDTLKLIEGYSYFSFIHSFNHSLYKDLWSSYSFLYSVVAQSCLTAIPWTVACLAPLPLGFSRQDYWSGLPCPSPGDLPDPRIEYVSLMAPALAGGFFTTSATSEALINVSHCCLFYSVTFCILFLLTLKD